MKKGILVAIAIILLLFIGGIAYIYSSIGSVISQSVAQAGTSITQTQVSVASSEYSTTSGLAKLSEVKVANPAGFSVGTALNVAQVDLWIDPESLNSGVIIVKSVILQSPEVTYEIKDSTDNLRTLKKQIEDSLNRTQSKPGEKKFQFDQVHIKNGTVYVNSPDFNGARRTATLGTISLTNLGKGQGGMTSAEFAHVLILEILRETTIAALNTDLPISDQARNIMNGALDETENAMKLLRNLLK
ncbi:AsmA family protein [Sneathiella glossodoripedis]|uniref:AsmA family protein n=1 Tax=Sneathiella glossodoripedis TaxID=418853 RepID=UPI000471EFBB|nr:AsmA family protein [Sneathiella glossodoripedis]